MMKTSSISHNLNNSEIAVSQNEDLHFVEELKLKDEAEMKPVFVKTKFDTINTDDIQSAEFSTS